MSFNNNNNNSGDNNNNNDIDALCGSIISNLFDNEMSSTEGEVNIIIKGKNKDGSEFNIESGNLKKIPSLKDMLNINNNKNCKYNVDLASASGDLKTLEAWLNDNPSENDYSNKALDKASENGHLNVLEWWFEKAFTRDLKPKYTSYAFDMACLNNQTQVVMYWLKNYKIHKVKRTFNAINFATQNCNTDILEEMDKIFSIEYSEKSFDDMVIKDKEPVERVINWWTAKGRKSPKFTQIFIDKLKSHGYNDLIDKLVKNNDSTNSLPTNTDRILPSAKKPIITENNRPQNKENDKDEEGETVILGIGDLLSALLGGRGGPGRLPQPKKDTNTPDLTNLPEHVRKYLEEKMEEAKEDPMGGSKIKQLIKEILSIPFGKYKIENIFKFITDLCNKVNKVSSENKMIGETNIKNEIELKNFFKKMEIFPASEINKYAQLYNQYCEFRKDYMNFVQKTLDETVYGHASTKKQLITLISQWLTSGQTSGFVLGVNGPPGVGKTTIIKDGLSKCLVDFIDYDLNCDEPFIKKSETTTPRPFCFTSLGGMTHGSSLIGHDITFHGSRHGDIVKHLKQSKCMNPIILFDELDKVSHTEHGYEIYSALTHITDPSQNTKFTDRYFCDLDIDLSKCITVFTYNDKSKIDRILRDRIFEINLKSIKPNEKLDICKQFILPEIFNSIGYQHSGDIPTISDSSILNIIESFTMEAGVRKIKEKLSEIFRYKNVERLKNNDNSPLILDDKYIDTILQDYHKVNHQHISKKPTNIGQINGMYYSSSGIGGLTTIQATRCYSDKDYGITITGNVEKVMNESVQVAKTLAYNLMSDDEQQLCNSRFKGKGIHIHFPSGGMPKDGPSGGTAITCALYSLFTNKPIPSDIAITGEIDLDGNVTEIGGLEEKLLGAKKAGVKRAIVPLDNARDVEIIKRNNSDITRDFTIYTCDNINQVKDIVFPNQEK